LVKKLQVYAIMRANGQTFLVEESEELLRRRPGLLRHVVVGVMSLADAAEQDGYDAGQTKHL